MCHSIGLEDSVTQYNIILKGNLDEHAPYKYNNVGHHYSQKWFNDDLRVMKKRRRCLERKFNKEKTQCG